MSFERGSYQRLGGDDTDVEVGSPEDAAHRSRAQQLAPGPPSSSGAPQRAIGAHHFLAAGPAPPGSDGSGGGGGPRPGSVASYARSKDRKKKTPGR